MKQNAFCPPNFTVLTPSNTDQLDTKGFFFCKTPKGQRVFVHVNNSPYLTPLSAKKYGPQPPVSQSVKGQVFVGRMVETPKGFNAEELRPFPSHYEWDAEGNYTVFYHGGIAPQTGKADGYDDHPDQEFWPQGLRDIASQKQAARAARVAEENRQREDRINATKSVLSSHSLAVYAALPVIGRDSGANVHRGNVAGLDVVATIETLATYPKITGPYVDVVLTHHARVSADGGFNSVTIIEPAGTERRLSPIEPEEIVDAFEHPDRPIYFKVKTGGGYDLLKAPRSEVELIAHAPYLDKYLRVVQTLEIVWGGRSFTETHHIWWDGDVAWGGRLEDFSQPRPSVRHYHEETTQPCIRYNPVYGGYDLAPVLAKRLAIEVANTTDPVLKRAEVGSKNSYSRGGETIWHGGPYIHLVYSLNGHDYDHDVDWTGDEAKFWLSLRYSLGRRVAVSQLERVCQSMIDQLKSGQYGVMYGGIGLIDISYSVFDRSFSDLPAALYIDPDSRTQHILVPEWALKHVNDYGENRHAVIARELAETDRQKHRLIRLTTPTYYMRVEPNKHRQPAECEQSHDTTLLENTQPTRTVRNTWNEVQPRPVKAQGRGLLVDVTSNVETWTHTIYSDGTRDKAKTETVTQEVIELDPRYNNPVFGPVRVDTNRKGKMTAVSTLGDRFDRLNVEDKRRLVQYNVDGLLTLNPTLWGITWDGDQMFTYILPDGSACAARFDKVNYQIYLTLSTSSNPDTFLGSQKVGSSVVEHPASKGKTFAQYMKERIGKAKK